MNSLGSATMLSSQDLACPLRGTPHRVLFMNIPADCGRTLSSALALQDIGCDWVDDLQISSDDFGREYDVLAVDVDNRRADAISFIEQMADSQCGLPLVVICSSLETQDTDQLMDLGVEDILVRPIEHGELATKIRWIASRSQKESLARSNRPALHSQARSNHSPMLDNHLVLKPVDRSQLARKLSQIDKVLPMSRSALDVFNMTTEGKHGADRIAAALCREPSLATEVLRIGNSSYYNHTGEKIADLEMAVARLGQKRVGELALAASTLYKMTADLFP